MMEYLQEEDAQSWLVASDAAVIRLAWSRSRPLTPGSPQSRSSAWYPSTGARLRARPAAGGHLSGLRPGFAEILSDVDTLNQPMIDTMRNTGHLDGVRPWHIWHYRAEVATLVDH